MQMNTEEMLNFFANKGRQIIESASLGDDALGPLKQLPGTWENSENTGWNMIALPFADDEEFGYRLLLNQYNETLKFSTVDKGVPNRGIDSDGDQFVAVLDYEQSIEQIAAEDFPESGKAGNSGLAIHREPGLWMHIINNRTNDIDIARLATIPHGDSVLALGRSTESTDHPVIPYQDGLPIGVEQSLDNPYLTPYKHFNDNLFEDLFTPVNPNALLDDANEGVNIQKVTRLDVDTKIETGGIVNIPFIAKQANATEMVSTFWIQELDELDTNGQPKLRLQYTQTVFLEFFHRTDGGSGLIRWPHVSINTLEKVS